MVNMSILSMVTNQRSHHWEAAACMSQEVTQPRTSHCNYGGRQKWTWPSETTLIHLSKWTGHFFTPGRAFLHLFQAVGFQMAPFAPLGFLFDMFWGT